MQNKKYLESYGRYMYNSFKKNLRKNQDYRGSILVCMMYT